MRGSWLGRRVASGVVVAVSLAVVSLALSTAVAAPPTAAAAASTQAAPPAPTPAPTSPSATARSPGVTAAPGQTPAGRAAPGAVSDLAITSTWRTPASLGDLGAPIALSSPTLATLSGMPAVVVGDRAGEVYAFYLTSPTTAPVAVPGWPVRLGAPIDATPSVGPTGDIFVGAGNATKPDTPAGGYYAIAPSGTILWHSSVVNPVTDTGPATGVEASLAVGTLDGTSSVAAGSLGQEAYALATASGQALAGWPFFDSDSVFSTPAMADLYGTGRTEIVEGAAQTAGLAYGQRYTSGGHLRILDGGGDLVCHYDADQAINSSPAVGDFLAGGQPGIVVGTGATFAGTSQTDEVLVLNDHCGLQWQTGLDGETWSSPALADVTGSGQLDVVEGTVTGPTTGSVYVLDAATGAIEWSAPTSGAVWGSVTTVAVGAGGVQDLFVPTTNGVDVFDGADGVELAVLDGPPSGLDYGTYDLGFQDSPLVTADPDGTVGVTVTGYGGADPASYVEHFEITVPTGVTPAAAVGEGTWPEFHHDPQLTGVTGPAGTAAPAAPCSIPSAIGDGYQVAGSDGGVYSFGQPFCGSLGGRSLDAPVVGAASAPDTGGYWLAAADGGVFAFGDAGFYGSMGGHPLDAPVAGIAATPDGRGYWEVAADGGVFAFGDAGFYGSMGGHPLVAPVVGIAATPDGRGYWEVAADGGVFNFGDAGFYGSMGGHPLAAPMVGIAGDPATGGYWEAAADGGVFSYFAPFFGSMGGVALARPIVGMAATGNGAGYRFVAADGGVFAFGDAGFSGSTGGQPLDAPVVAVTN